MTRNEQIAVLFLGLMVLGAAAIFLLARRHYRQVMGAPAERAPSRRIWIHGAGCIGFFLLPMPLIALLPPLTLLPAAGFLCMAGARLIAPPPLKPRVPWVLLLCSVVWLMDWGYESEIRKWAETVQGPIRSDLILVAPLLYFVSVVGISTFLGTSATKRDEPLSLFPK
jgi:hypothetical protein